MVAAMAEATAADIAAVLTEAVVTVEAMAEAAVADIVRFAATKPIRGY